MADKIVDIDKMIDSGANYKPGINDQLPVEIRHDPKGDEPVDIDLFERVMSGERLTKEDLKPEVSKPEEKKVEKSTLEIEEEESQRKLDEKKKLLQEEEKEEVEKAKKEADDDNKEEKEKEKEEEEKKLPPTAKLPKPPASTEDVAALVKDLGLPETSAAFFKKMDKASREFVVAELKRRGNELETTKASLETAKKSVKEGIPTNWYDHKNAYVLLPDYQKAVAASAEVKDHIAHFREQLIAIEDGQDWIDRVMDGKGNIVNVPRKVTAESGTRMKYDLLTRINALERLADQQDQHANQIAGGFIEYHKHLKEDVKAKEDEYFPQYANEEEFSKNEWGKYAMNLLEASGQGSNPIARMFSKLYAFALETQQENQELKKAQKKNGKIPGVNNQGPTGDEIDKGSIDESGRRSTNPDEAGFDEDDFIKVKQRGHLY